MGAGAWISLSERWNGPGGLKGALGKDRGYGLWPSTFPAQSTRAAVPPHLHPNVLQRQHLRRSHTPLVSGSVGLQFTPGHLQRGRLPSPTPLHICPNMDMCVRFPGQVLGRTRILGGFYWSFIYERFLQSFSDDEDAPSLPGSSLTARGSPSWYLPARSGGSMGVK